MRFQSHRLDDFELRVGYYTQKIHGKDTVKFPTPSWATCDIFDYSNPHLKLTLKSDSAVITEDTLYIQFYHRGIGKIAIAGRFIQTKSPFYSTVGENEIITSPLIVITSKSKIILNKKVDFKYTNDEDKINRDFSWEYN